MFIFFFYMDINSLDKNIRGRYHFPRYEFLSKTRKSLEIFCSQLRYNTLIILLEFFSLILVNLSSDVFHKPQMIM